MEGSFVRKAGAGYYLAWIPLAGLLVLLLGRAVGWQAAVVVALPSCAVYAFVCRSSRYLCRILPLRRMSGPRIAVTQLLAALLASTLFVLLAGQICVAALGAEAAERVRRQIPLLFIAGVSFYLLAVAFHYILLALEAAQEAETRAAEARVLAREAELGMLKAQVNPHFLFNSLHSISALAGADAGRAREMCILLSDFLRTSLGLGGRTSIPLREELALARNYLAVEQVRFGDRMEVREEIEDGCLDCLLPPLLLQPLVENAVKHGIAMLAEEGDVVLKARAHGHWLAVTIENRFDPEAPARNRTGLGLENVRRRLSARYGDEARLEARASGDRFRAELRLPVERERKH